MCQRGTRDPEVTAMTTTQDETHRPGFDVFGPLQAHQIAAAAELPPAQTAKMLQQMAHAEFTESSGGWGPF